MTFRQALGSQTTLLDKFVQRRLRWFWHAERMTIDQIPHNVPYAGVEGKQTKAVADPDYNGKTM